MQYDRKLNANQINTAHTRGIQARELKGQDHDARREDHQADEDLSEEREGKINII